MTVSIQLPEELKHINLPLVRVFSRVPNNNFKIAREYWKEEVDKSELRRIISIIHTYKGEEFYEVINEFFSYHQLEFLHFHTLLESGKLNLIPILLQDSLRVGLMLDSNIDNGGYYHYPKLTEQTNMVDLMNLVKENLSFYQYITDEKDESVIRSIVIDAYEQFNDLNLSNMDIGVFVTGEQFHRLLKICLSHLSN